MTALPAPFELAAVLSSWRSARGLDITCAARTFDVHPTTYKGWESGRRRPYPRRHAQLADALQISEARVAALAGPGPRRPGRTWATDISALTRARLATGMNRHQLGRLLNIGPASIYKWETGLVRPPADHLPLLARHLNLTIDEMHRAVADHPESRFDGCKLPSLRDVLRRHGLSRAAAGSLLNISPSTMYEWETGRRRVPPHAVQTLADCIGIPADDLRRHAAHTRVQPVTGPTLTSLRRRVHMTQREASAVLGISASSLGRFETGRRALPLSLVRPLASLYKVPSAVVVRAGAVPVPEVLRSSTWTPDQLPVVLHELRLAAGTTLTEIAALTGVTHPTARRWELGLSVPTAGVLQMLELHYRLNPGRLTSLTHPRPSATHLRQTRHARRVGRGVTAASLSTRGREVRPLSPLGVPA